MDNLFTYGTLMCEDIMETVSKSRLSRLHGTLRGFCRRSVKDELYPVVIPDDEGRVEGIVYRNVPDTAWESLDRYEGEMYERLTVQIELDDGSILMAEVYVARPEFREDLEESDWDFDEFLRSGKPRFINEYKGYSLL